jgi:hypothetical protein
VELRGRGVERLRLDRALTGAAINDAEVATFDPTGPNGRVVGRVSTVEQNGSNGSSFSFDFGERVDSFLSDEMHDRGSVPSACR